MKKIKAFLISTAFISFSLVSCGGGGGGGSSKKVSLISIYANYPEKDYIVNSSSLNKSDIEVYGYYSDNTTKKITDFTWNYDDSKVNFTENKSYTFNISYGTVNDSFIIKPKNSLSDPDDYTVLIYMCASTLESDPIDYGYEYGSATVDLAEMLAPTTPSNVNVVIETGGTQKWGNVFTDLDSNKIQRWHIHNHSLENDGVYGNYSSNPSLSMGSPNTLKDFINYGLSNYPAQKTALVLWDHGGGMMGVCEDDRTQNDDNILLNFEVKTALQNSNIGTNKLEWIGYDACLMAMQDIASFNSGYAKYMISSQENEPGCGWNYTAWLSALYKNPSITTKQLFKVIEESYIEEASSSSLYPTISLLDLDETKINTYNTNWEAFASAIQTKIIDPESSFQDKKDAWDAMTNVINSIIYKFGATQITYSTSSSGRPIYTDTFYPYNCFDISFALGALSVDETYSGILGQEIGDVFDALYDIVIDTNTYVVCGLSFFCPIEPNSIIYLYNSKIGKWVKSSLAADVECYATQETPFSTWQSLCYTYGEWRNK